MKKTVGIITNASPSSGVGSRAYEIAQRLKDNTDFDASLVMINGEENTIGNTTLSRWPSVLGSKSVSWIRLARHIPEFDIYDITNQSLSFIAKTKKPSIVTVHDIIELTHPQDPRAFLLNKYLLRGISHADRIVAVSQYTKDTLISYLNIPEQSITVIPNGVSASFYNIPDFSSTIARSPIVLCVGSEHPRKNIETVLKTIAILKTKYPDVLLLKVGEAGIRSGRIKTLELIDSLGIAQQVKLMGTVSEERLNELYNIADAVLCPSLYEGFGLSVLQGFATGCPVVCSNTTSLPEVAGDAALLHEPNNAEAYAESITNILEDTELRDSLITKGLERAKKFSWDIAARDMLDIYKTLA